MEIRRAISEPLEYVQDDVTAVYSIYCSKALLLGRETDILMLRERKGGKEREKAEASDVIEVAYGYLF